MYYFVSVCLSIYLMSLLLVNFKYILRGFIVFYRSCMISLQQRIFIENYLSRQPHSCHCFRRLFQTQGFFNPSFSPHSMFKIKQNRLYKSTALTAPSLLHLEIDGPFAMKNASIEGLALSYPCNP